MGTSDFLSSRKSSLKVTCRQLDNKDFREKHDFEDLVLSGEQHDSAFNFVFDRNERERDQVLPVTVRTEGRRPRSGFVVFTHEDQEGGGYELHVSRVYVTR